MTKNSSYRFNGIILYITLVALPLAAARVGMAQSNNPTGNLESLAASGDAAYGAEVYHRVGCVECHGQNAEGSDGPPLLKIKMSFPEFVHWVRNASNGMDPQPSAIVSDAELADIYAFIGGNPKSADSQPVGKTENHAEATAPAGDAAYGAEVYHRVGCVECHGQNAEGSDGPPLLKIKMSFPEFVHWVRNASNGMDPQPPAIVSDAELADIYAFIGGNSKSANSQPGAKAESHADGTAPHGNSANGTKLFHTIGCAKCHGENAEGSIGPSLVTIKKTFPEFVNLVREPEGEMPNTFTPDVVSEAQLADIYAFLQRPSDSTKNAK